MTPYLKLVMTQVHERIQAAGIVPADSVFLAYSPNLETILGNALATLNIAVLVNKPSLTNNASVNEPDAHKAHLSVEVATNIVTSEYDVTDIAEQLYSLIHKSNVLYGVAEDSRFYHLDPSAEIIARSMIEGDNSYMLNFEFNYKLKTIK